MSLSATCPSCDATYQLADSMRGKRVRCKSCAEPFVVRDPSTAADDDEDAEAIQVGPRSTKRAAMYDEDDDTRRPAPRRRTREKSGNNALVPLLIAGGLVTVLLILGLAGAVVWAFTRSRKSEPPPMAASSNPPSNAAHPFQNPPQNQGAAPPQAMAPPGNPLGQPAMPANGALAVELSNGNISGFGAQMQVTVDYRFTSGNPAGRRLFLLIKPTRGMGIMQKYYRAELRILGGNLQGTFSAQGMTFGIENGPFEMWVAEGQPGIGMVMAENQMQKISNVVTVATKQFAPPGMRPPFGPRGIPPGMRR